METPIELKGQKFKFSELSFVMPWSEKNACMHFHYEKLLICVSWLYCLLQRGPGIKEISRTCSPIMSWVALCFPHLWFIYTVYIKVSFIFSQSGWQAPSYFAFSRSHAHHHSITQGLCSCFEFCEVQFLLVEAPGKRCWLSGHSQTWTCQDPMALCILEWPCIMQ